MVLWSDYFKIESCGSLWVFNHSAMLPKQMLQVLDLASGVETYFILSSWIFNYYKFSANFNFILILEVQSQLKGDWITLIKNKRINGYTEKDNEIKSMNILLVIVGLTPVWDWKMSSMLLLFCLNLGLGFMKVMFWRWLNINVHWYKNKGWFFLLLILRLVFNENINV